MPSVAIYTRLSRDSTGEQTATARQEADCRKLADLRGWDVEAVFEDVDLSAYRRGVHRPGLERMLAAVGAGDVDGVLVWKMDRLVRRAVEFERVWRVCEEAGGFLASVSDSIDTSTATGRAMARIIASFGELESDTMSLRIRRAQEEAAQAGRKHFGGRRPFGLDKTWTTIVEDEAAVIREGAARVLDGDSLRSIVRDWEARGISSATGGVWKQAALRTLLLSPRVAGMRAHKGTVVADGTWPAILDRATVAALRQVLTDPARKAAHAGRRFLLGGLIYCTKCGGKMRGGVSSYGLRRYACPAPPEGCGGRTIAEAPLDTLIADAVMLRLDTPALASTIAGHACGTDVTDAVAQLADIEARLNDLAALWADGRITRDEWMAARGRLDTTAEALRRRIARARDTDALAGYVGEEGALARAWPKLTLEDRRAVLAAIVDRIEIAAAPVKGRNRFDPDRVNVVWRA